jgi:hypothetical protein
VKVLHDNLDVLRGDATAFNTLVNSLPGVRNYLLSKAGNAVQATGNMAYNAAGYAATLAQAGAATIGAHLPETGGLMTALRDHTANVTTTTAQYATNAWSSFAATVFSLGNGLLPETPPQPVMLA